MRPILVYPVFSEPISGIWCDGCMTSARVRWPVHFLSSRGVSNADAERCLNCDPREGDDDDD